MNRSHSRHSHSFDKLILKFEKSWCIISRRVVKKMHIKKQRQHNSKILKNINIDEND